MWLLFEFYLSTDIDNIILYPINHHKFMEETYYE